MRDRDIRSQSLHYLEVGDRYILQCGGAVGEAVKAACYRLDPDHGHWVRAGSLTAGRVRGSSSLYGADADILITGGRGGNDDPHSSVELFRNGQS